MKNSLQKVLDFLNRLDESGLGYSLEHNREDTLTAFVAVPGERWEVEFHADGDVDVEVFYSDEEQDDLEGEEALERLFAENEDEEDDEDLEYEEDEDEDDDEEEDEDEDDEDSKPR